MTFYEAVCKMEEMRVTQDYIDGWMSGYLRNPHREEQRINDTYTAGYEDGLGKNPDNFVNWKSESN